MAVELSNFNMKPKMLSPLETACLRWMSRGRTVVEIAAIEGKRVADIELSVERAILSLGTKPLAEAIELKGLGSLR